LKIAKDTGLFSNDKEWHVSDSLVPRLIPDEFAVTKGSPAPKSLKTPALVHKKNISHWYFFRLVPNEHSPVESPRLTDGGESTCEAEVVYSVERQQVEQKLLPLLLTQQECIRFIQLPVRRGQRLTHSQMKHASEESSVCYPFHIIVPTPTAPAQIFYFHIVLSSTVLVTILDVQPSELSSVKRVYVIWVCT
jgi:hypothetical protein